MLFGFLLFNIYLAAIIKAPIEVIALEYSKSCFEKPLQLFIPRCGEAAFNHGNFGFKSIKASGAVSGTNSGAWAASRWIDGSAEVVNVRLQVCDGVVRTDRLEQMSHSADADVAVEAGLLQLGQAGQETRSNVFDEVAVQFDVFKFWVVFEQIAIDMTNEVPSDGHVYQIRKGLQVACPENLQICVAPNEAYQAWEGGSKVTWDRVSLHTVASVRHIK